MRACYLAALIAITMSIASHVFVLGTVGPIVPEFFAGVRSRARMLPAGREFFPRLDCHRTRPP